MGKCDYTILNYTLYLLHKNGDTFRHVDDYAAEFLKTFWQVVFQSKSVNAIYHFIREYRKFCIRVLLRTGLITVEEPVSEDAAQYPDFKMLATPFFREIFRFKI